MITGRPKKPIILSDEEHEHIARHCVAPEEVEEVCYGNHVAFRGRHGRYVVFGQTMAGRFLKVVLEGLKAGGFRPITAFDMSDVQKHSYRNRTGR